MPRTARPGPSDRPPARNVQVLIGIALGLPLRGIALKRRRALLVLEDASARKGFLREVDTRLSKGRTWVYDLLHQMPEAGNVAPNDTRPLAGQLVTRRNRPFVLPRSSRLRIQGTRTRAEERTDGQDGRRCARANPGEDQKKTTTTRTKTDTLST